MNDFRTTLLWLRALEILIGNSSWVLMGELNQDLFATYRSPWRA